MEKKIKAEKAIDIAMTSFLSYQEKAEERFHEKEDIINTSNKTS